MSKEERELCKKLLERTKLGTITWKAKGKCSFATKIDNVDIGVSQSYSGNDLIGYVYSYWLDIANGEGATRLGNNDLGDLWPLWKLHPLVALFTLLQYINSEETKRAIRRTRLVGKLAEKIQ